MLRVKKIKKQTKNYGFRKKYFKNIILSFIHICTNGHTRQLAKGVTT